VVVLALDVGPQAAVERLEAGGVVGLKMREELSAHGPEPALLLTLALGLMRACMDQGHTELGAHQGEVMGAEVRPVVDDMWPVSLCGGGVTKARGTRRRPRSWAHNLQSDCSHFNSDGSSRHIARLGDPPAV